MQRSSPRSEIIESSNTTRRGNPKDRDEQLSNLVSSFAHRQGKRRHSDSGSEKLGNPLARFRAWGASQFERAMDLNLQQIRQALAPLRGRSARILDLGCWDGANTIRYVPGDARTSGVEINTEAAAEARSRGIDVAPADLNSELPFNDETFDAVVSNQVIEHLSNTDAFLSEAFRVLRPQGILAVSTENMASWHNIGALVLGWQAFSLTNVSQHRAGVGNPLANLRGVEPMQPGWEHLRIFSTRGLKELVEAHGFEDVQVRGSGYYPFPSRLGTRDPRHAALITAVARRPATSDRPKNGVALLRYEIKK
jgi:SAM-dependent methyltransferase